MALVLKTSSAPLYSQKELIDNDEPIIINAINSSPATETVQGAAISKN